MQCARNAACQCAVVGGQRLLPFLLQCPARDILPPYLHIWPQGGAAVLEEGGLDFVRDLYLFFFDKFQVSVAMFAPYWTSQAGSALAGLCCLNAPVIWLHLHPVSAAFPPAAASQQLSVCKSLRSLSPCRLQGAVTEQAWDVFCDSMPPDMGQLPPLCHPVLE